MTSAIAGARRPEQIEETVRSGEVDLDEAVLDRIDEILADRLNEI